MSNIPLAFAHSPSGCAILCIAVGEIPTGIETLVSKTTVDRSVFDTFLKQRGRILYLYVNRASLGKYFEKND